MTIELAYKLNAAVADEPRRPVKALPGRLTASNVLKVLTQLGITVPEKIVTLAASGEALAASDFHVGVATMDEALAKNVELPFSERLRLKYAADRLGLLKI